MRLGSLPSFFFLQASTCRTNPPHSRPPLCFPQVGVFPKCPQAPPPPPGMSSASFNYLPGLFQHRFCPVFFFFFRHILGTTPPLRHLPSFLKTALLSMSSHVGCPRSSLSQIIPCTSSKNTSCFFSAIADFFIGSRLFQRRQLTRPCTNVTGFCGEWKFFPFSLPGPPTAVDFFHAGLPHFFFPVGSRDRDSGPLPARFGFFVFFMQTIPGKAGPSSHAIGPLGCLRTEGLFFLRKENFCSGFLPHTGICKGKLPPMVRFQDVIFLFPQALFFFLIEFPPPIPGFLFPRACTS